MRAARRTDQTRPAGVGLSRGRGGVGDQEVWSGVELILTETS
uniref:Uncharacterized protein n=1 Tax=Verrucosispora sp. MS100047 TaxID=1410949 RepID=A0A097CRK5_9ACTN|nr:hypothetical protein VASRM7_26 [Verrucosispora sp. MS100047]